MTVRTYVKITRQWKATLYFLSRNTENKSKKDCFNSPPAKKKPLEPKDEYMTMNKMLYNSISCRVLSQLWLTAKN